MLIDCDGCAVRGVACHDCVVTVLLGPARAQVELGDAERQALVVLADGGLVPPLRLVAPDPPDGRLADDPARRTAGEVARGRRRHAAG
jgi:hypothetical protein